ncbi:acVLRF1 family peptidyl-tRNA hydrolase [Herbihabitans rhizosphaerae]|uniref:acVLRF1 family peptidyl-tRNA hydrolase n=1 Tax=Herbihabitans rhizosphaerae TaxID=1872711 RepID=UPI00102B9206|nr:acVLRF1 family peptidyl-tRNA hydrolase [Herbihabitans rhizosphaerae]
MGRTRAVAGGGRAVEVEPERVAGWFDRFGERHGGVSRTVLGQDEVRVEAADGATATIAVPFAPLAGEPGEQVGLFVQPFIEHLVRERTVGLVLARVGGHSVGMARGGKVIASRTDRRHVQGRSAAGGWSQQRFARRRAGQARQALEAAADDVAEVLLPRVRELDAVVLGGDRRALDTVLADRRLAPIAKLAEPRVLDVAEPRRTVLDEAAHRAFCVEIVIREP